MSPPRLQVFILSRDRVEMFAQTLRTVLDNRVDGMEVVVSDNSTTDAVSACCAREFPSVRVVRRDPPVAAIPHFNAVVQEADAEFLVVFHDDDLMAPGFATSLLALMDAHPEAAAAACNAWILRGDEPTTELYRKTGTATVLRSPQDLFEGYFSLEAPTPPPFPGYIYRTRFVRQLTLDAREGGKHSDVTFLAKLLAFGSVVWDPRPLMHYRIHAANDSRQVSPGDRLSLLRFAASRRYVDRRSMAVRDFKFRMWSKWWVARRRAKALQGWRDRVLLRFIAAHALRMALTRPRATLRALRAIRG